MPLRLVRRYAMRGLWRSRVTKQLLGAVRLEPRGLAPSPGSQ